MSSLNLSSNPEQTTARPNTQAATSSSNNREKQMTQEKSTAPDFWAHVDNGRLFGQHVSAANGSSSFTNMVNVMRQTLKEFAEKGGDRYDVVPFAKEMYPELHFSVITIVRNTRIPLLPGMAAHGFVTAQNLLIESTGDSLRSYQADDRGRDRGYMVTQTSEDVNNRELVAFIENQLFAAYPGIKNVYQIDPVVVRRTMKAENPDDIKRLLEASTVGVETRSMVRHPAFSDYNYVSRMGSQDLALPVTLEFTGGSTQTDAEGLPHYTDAIVTVTVEPASKNGRGPGYVPNSSTVSKKICQVGTMVDLVNVDPDELLDNNRRRNRDFEPEVAWAPRIVVTSIEQYLTRTPSGIFFAMSSIAELGANRTWVNTFRGSRGTAGDVNLRDLGNLNIEANLTRTDNSVYGQPIETSTGFGDREMVELLDRTVTRTPMFAVDCPTTGANAYYTTLLYLLARGNDGEKRQAHDELARSLRDATNGLIDRYIKLDEVDFLEDDGETLHTGFWIDNNGAMRDIRELDNYLAMASRFGAGNPEALIDWSNTWLRNDQSEAQRMAERLELLQKASQGGVTVQGTALRVTLNADVVTAFGKALSDGGLPLISRDGGNGDQFQSQRNVKRHRPAARYSGNGFGSRDSRGSAGSGRRRDHATRV